MGNRNNIWCRVGDTRDVFEHRHYRTNKVLSIITGQWPYLTTRARRCSFLLIFLGLVSQVAPLTMAVVKYHDDWECLLESAPASIVGASIVVKLACSVWNSQKIGKFGHRIRKLTLFTNMLNMGERSQSYTQDLIMLSPVTVVSTFILFATQPAISKIIDVLLKNGSEPGEFPFPVYYYHIDEQKYYVSITMFSFLCIIGAGLITVSIDNMFIVYVQHVCGLFSAVGQKLQRNGNNERPIVTGKITYASGKRDMDFDRIVWCIKRHNEAIEYAKLIEATYSWCLFILVGCNMFMTSIIGFQIVEKAKDPRESVKLIVLLIAETGHLYAESYMSQILMDHSTDILSYIHLGKWYRLSQAAQKLLILMMMRCNQSCKLTAGKIMTMSIKTFVTILHTALSYFTLLRSI